MRKQVLIVLILAVVACSAQDGSVESRGKKKRLYYGLIHYWAFLALKAKIIFLIGTFISFWVFAGKVFAFLYYYKNKESCRCPEYHSEKIVVSDEPHYEHKYSTIFNSKPPDDYYPGGQFYEQNPSFPPYERYSRSMENSIFGNMDIFKSVIKKADLTELAFDAMNLKKKSCKMRFICEAEQHAKNNSWLAFTLYMFSDNGFMKYRANTTQLSMEECTSLGPQCGFIAN